MGHALANTVLEFGVARFLLGVGESGNFPTAIKVVAEWFPQNERALATGILNRASTWERSCFIDCPVDCLAFRLARALSAYRSVQRDMDPAVVLQLSRNSGNHGGQGFCS